MRQSEEYRSRLRKRDKVEKRKAKLERKKARRADHKYKVGGG